MAEKPILFSTEMVKAILKGQKTQTRRVIKPQPTLEMDGEIDGAGNQCGYGLELHWKGKLLYPPRDCPYGQPGDILWLRETWCREWKDPEGFTGKYLYKADGVEVIHVDGSEKSPWRPSIHMPREAARIFLKVKNVRVERLQDISKADALAEGVDAINGWLLDRSDKWCRYTIKVAEQQGRSRPRVADAIGGFACLWDSINGKRGYGWESNPLVWVIEFEMVKP